MTRYPEWFCFMGLGAQIAAAGRETKARLFRDGGRLRWRGMDPGCSIFSAGIHGVGGIVVQLFGFSPVGTLAEGVCHICLGRARIEIHFRRVEKRRLLMGARIVLEGYIMIHVASS